MKYTHYIPKGTNIKLEYGISLTNHKRAIQNKILMRPGTDTIQIHHLWMMPHHGSGPPQPRYASWDYATLKRDYPITINQDFSLSHDPLVSIMVRIPTPQSWRNSTGVIAVLVAQFNICDMTTHTPVIPVTLSNIP